MSIEMDNLSLSRRLVPSGLPETEHIFASNFSSRIISHYHGIVPGEGCLHNIHEMQYVNHDFSGSGMDIISILTSFFEFLS